MTVIGWMTAAILFRAVALELSSEEAWASIDDAGEIGNYQGHPRKHAKSHFQTRRTRDWESADGSVEEKCKRLFSVAPFEQP